MPSYTHSVNADGMIDRLIKHRYWQTEDDRGAQLLVVDAEIDEVEFNDTEFFSGGATLDNVVFRNCKFNKCNLSNQKANDSEFDKCVFVDSNLSALNASRAKIHKCEFRNCKLSGAHFENASVVASIFYDANMTNCDISDSNFTGSKFARTNLHNFEVRGARLIGVKGLFGDMIATTTVSRNGDWAAFHHDFDLISWASLRSIGSFRLFGVSYFFLIALILFINVSYRYNLYIVDNPYGISVFNPAIRFDLPLELGLTLIAIFMLATGATLFELFCPPPVKESSEIRWTNDLERSVVEYRSASWTYRTMGWKYWAGWRYLCFVMYGFGGAWTFGYLLYRVIVSAWYIF